MVKTLASRHLAYRAWRKQTGSLISQVGEATAAVARRLARMASGGAYGGPPGRLGAVGASTPSDAPEEAAPAFDDLHAEPAKSLGRAGGSAGSSKRPRDAADAESGFPFPPMTLVDGLHRAIVAPALTKVLRCRQIVSNHA